MGMQWNVLWMNLLPGTSKPLCLMLHTWIISTIPLNMIEYSLWNVWNPIIESIEILAHVYWHALVHSMAYFRGLLGKLGGLISQNRNFSPSFLIVHTKRYQPSIMKFSVWWCGILWRTVLMSMELHPKHEKAQVFQIK